MYEQPYNPYAKNMAIVKGYLQSGKVLALGIFNLIAAALSIVACFFSGGLAADVTNFLLSEMQKSYDIQPDLYKAIKDSATGTPVNSLISAIPGVLVTILIAVAFILMYAKSRNEEADSSPRAGVNILYVLSMIAMILSIICVVIMVLGIIVLIWLALSVLNVEELSAVEIGDYVVDLQQLLVPLLIVGVVCLVITAFFLLFVTVNKKRFYGSIRSSISSVELTRSGAKPYGVMCVIGTVFSGLGLLFLPLEIIAFVSMSFSSQALIAVIISAIAQVVAFLTILFEARFALGYAKYIDNEKYGYHRHMEDNKPSYAAYTPGNTPTATKQTNPYKDGGYNDGFGDSKKTAADVKKTCPACGGEVNGTSPFCGRCGHKL